MYRKYTSDRIFTGYDFVPPGTVLIMNSGGVVIDLVPRELAGDDIRFLPGLLIPGLVNAHCHIELSHLKGKIPMHTGLTAFVQQVMQKREASPDQKMEAMLDAEQELLESGTVAVGDICNTPDSIALKKNSRLYWQHFIEVTGFVPSTAEKRWAAATGLADEFRRHLDPSTVTIVPHAPYSVSQALLARINEHTDGHLLSIHNQESPAEDYFFRNGTGEMRNLYQNLGIDISFFEPPGTSSLSYWLPRLNRGQRIIAVHNTFTQAEDVNIQKELLKTGAHTAFYYCLCPGANQYIEGVYPPLDLFFHRSCRLVIGTDSLASNHRLDVWDEIIRLRQAFPHIPEKYFLEWATIGGAAALGLETRLGSFERGKQPGLVRVHEGRAQRVWD